MMNKKIWNKTTLYLPLPEGGNNILVSWQPEMCAGLFDGYCVNKI